MEVGDGTQQLCDDVCSLLLRKPNLLANPTGQAKRTICEMQPLGSWALTHTHKRMALAAFSVLLEQYEQAREFPEIS